ncbi:MAG: hypothetical protein ACPLQO_02970 [Desulfotomaculales bacterium]
MLFSSAARFNLPPRLCRVGYVFRDYALLPHLTVEQKADLEDTAALGDRVVRLEKGRVTSGAPGGQDKVLAEGRKKGRFSGKNRVPVPGRREIEEAVRAPGL